MNILSLLFLPVLMLFKKACFSESLNNSHSSFSDLSEIFAIISSISTVSSSFDGKFCCPDIKTIFYFILKQGLTVKKRTLLEISMSLDGHCIIIRRTLNNLQRRDRLKILLCID